ncbi:MAG: hypothetical protein ACKOGA_15545 [Planctomycetaceae bacterium]
MPTTYRRHGVSLTCPSSWELREESEPGELRLNYEQPSTCFWSLTLLFSRPDPEQTIETTLEAFRSEYEEIDIYEAKARVGRRSARAYDIDFLCYEMTSSACVRVFAGPRFTGVIVYQGADPEFGPFAARCEEVARSIRCYRPSSEERHPGGPFATANLELGDRDDEEHHGLADDEVELEDEDDSVDEELD